MSIKDRALKPGTILVATYKKQDHKCTVVEGEDGKLVFRVHGGEDYKSPSAAGKAVMDGVACNGWRFWSVEGEEEPKAEKKASAKPKAKAKAAAKRKPAAKKASKAATKVACGDCGQEFPDSAQASKHMADEHGSVEAGPGSGK